MLALHDLQAGYGDSQVLFGLSLTLGEGSVGTLLGRNGMGKTSTVRAIMGLLPTRGGLITFRDRDITDWPAYKVAQAGIGLVPEGRQVFPNLTLRENLVATARRNGAGHWDLSRIFDLFPRLEERQRNMGNQLSGGEQQMLAIARALMSRPRLLLLDEPSLGLAPIIVKQIFAAIRQINQDEGMTVFLVEQNAYHALMLAHRGYVMVNGQITLSGEGRELLKRPEVRAAYLEGGH